MAIAAAEERTEMAVIVPVLRSMAAAPEMSLAEMLPLDTRSPSGRPATRLVSFPDSAGEKDANALTGATSAVRETTSVKRMPTEPPIPIATATPVSSVIPFTGNQGEVHPPNAGKPLVPDS
jgi:hypothetical protein